MDDGEDTETGLRRELKEELNLDIEISKTDWVTAHHVPSSNIVCHLYCKEVKEEQFIEMEKASLDAIEFGVEMLGNIRVPLYTYTAENGSLKGFPQFLKNNFCGSARVQLLECLKLKNVLTEEEIRCALDARV